MPGDCYCRFAVAGGLDQAEILNGMTEQSHGQTVVIDNQNAPLIHTRLPEFGLCFLASLRT